MLWDRIIESPLAQYIDLERYVNDGSPSGFPTVPGSLGDPQHDAYYAPLELPVFLVPVDRVITMGQEQSIPASLRCSHGYAPVAVHPRYEQSATFPLDLRKCARKTVTATPTASVRTVVVHERGHDPFCVKLHYPWTLGRFKRDIPLYKLLASVESSRLLREASHLVSPTFGYFDECFCTFYHTPDGGFGTVLRAFPQAHPGSVLVPAFSLFSTDKLEPNHTPLLDQIVKVASLSPDDAISELIEPLLESFVTLSARSGLLPEWNAQNVVFQFSPAGRLDKVCIRDMEDLWRDHTLLQQRGSAFTALRYHSITQGLDDDYFKRRSFMYDFKLGEYVLSPLLERLSSIFSVPEPALRTQVRNLATRYWQPFSRYFADDDLWFSYPQHSAVDRGHYIENKHPKYR